MTDKKQNEVSESKEIPHEINSVSDLSQILQTLGQPEKGYTRFFRGHADESWKLLPSIYRETYLIENEDKIIKDTLTYCPDDFLPSDTLFEKLVKLQHYGYSTRLLDLTANALVALYFALGDKQQHNKDGELIIFNIPDSDTVAILSAISLRNFSFSISEEIELAEYISTIKRNKYWKENIECHGITEDDIQNAKTSEKNIGPLKLVDFLNVLEVSSEETKIREFLEYFNRYNNIISLLHDIQTDKPSFRPVINPDDLQRVLCVRAKLNNARISRQQGCFLLFGIRDKKEDPALIPDGSNDTSSWQQKPSKEEKFIVPSKSKKDIRKELESFGISKRTLFPELEAQAKEIMDYYKGQK